MSIFIYISIFGIVIEGDYMEFRNFNKNFRRNVTTTSPEVADSLCDVGALHAQGDKIFTNKKCDCEDPNTGEPYEVGKCLVHSNAVLRARAWRTSRQCEDVSNPSVRDLNEWADEALRAANLKNMRKRMALLVKEGKDIPQWMSEQHDGLKSAPSYTHTRRATGPQGRVPRRADLSAKTTRRRASTVHWEEVKGPNGKIILFELLFENGRFVGRRRASQGEFPQKGSIVLDTTAPGEGFKVWRMRKTRRRPMPKTPQMQAIYESSFLYKVRQLAAGQISVQELHDATRLTGPEAVWSEASQFGMGAEPGHWVSR